MPIDPANTVYYRQARFTSRLPKHYLYAPSHYWLEKTDSGVFRVGITKFASRMLGDFVELDFSVSPGDEVALGQPIGTIEGFKALSEVYCAIPGKFLGANEKIMEQPEIMDTDPYDRGWIYQVEGNPPEDVLSVDGYVKLLDATIEKMLDADKEQDAC